MLELYWGCLIFGTLVAIVSVLFGDVLDQIFDGVFDVISFGFLNTLTLSAIVTGFGGAGILLTEYRSFAPLVTLSISLTIGIFLAFLVYFMYVKPMKNSENSAAYSMQDLIGQLCEIITPIPKQGYGEVLVVAGFGNTNHPAASFDGSEIATGQKVVIVEIKEGVLYVAALD